MLDLGVCSVLCLGESFARHSVLGVFECLRLWGDFTQSFCLVKLLNIGVVDLQGYASHTYAEVCGAMVLRKVDILRFSACFVKVSLFLVDRCST